MKKNRFILSIVATAFVTAPVLVCAQAVPAASDLFYFTDFFGQFLVVLDDVVLVLTGLALAFFIWGLVVFIRNSGDEKAKDEGKQKMIWGIIALFFIISVWGLVALLQEVTGVDGGAAGLSAPAIL
jgi:hypothetical protein